MLFEGRPVDVLTYVGYSRSHCGYCGKNDTSHSFGLWAHSLTPETYQKLVDRGWRRSGHYLYRPNLRQSCCKAYTIRLDASCFKPDKKHRQTLYKFNRFVSGETLPERQSKSAFVLQDILNESERQSITEDDHSFETTFTQPTFTKEKFELYKKYQIAIHHDEPATLKQSGFKRFLCDSPLQDVPIRTKPSETGISHHSHPEKYGSLHQLYRLDGKLIALAVLDILPHCVSSVYFIYDPDYAHLSLGRVSACREAALAVTLSCYRASVESIRKDDASPGRLQSVQSLADLYPKRSTDAYYYMGFYIPTCPKMAYKGEYAPSYLLDPASKHGEPEWQPLKNYQDTWRQCSDRKKHSGDSDPDEIEWFYSFLNPGLERSKHPLAVDEDELTDPETLWISGMPGISPRSTSLSDNVKVLEDGVLRYFDRTDDEQVRKQLEAIAATIGHDLMKEVIITI